MPMLFIAVAALAATPAGDAALAALDTGRAEQLAACGVDADRLGALLALDQNGFDQDFTGGWRTVAARQGCDGAAADLIEVWRDYSPFIADAAAVNWSAGQMRARAGQTQAAIALLRRARDGATARRLHAEATIAFLSGDREALQTARDALAALRLSERQIAARRALLADNPELQAPEGFTDAPAELAIVDRLLACFGADYADAYAGRCRESARRRDSAAACSVLQQRIHQARVSPPVDIALAVSPDWAESPARRGELADLIAQEGRTREAAAFGFAYDPGFADAAAALTESDLDRIADAWAGRRPIACDGLDTGDAPFNADMNAFHAWADAAMLNPAPGAPMGAQTLALTRPVVFDNGARLIVIEQSSYTPIPLSRPPSALAVVVIYARGGDGWEREASIVLARGG